MCCKWIFHKLQATTISIFIFLIIAVFSTLSVLIGQIMNSQSLYCCLLLIEWCDLHIINCYLLFEFMDSPLLLCIYFCDWNSSLLPWPFTHLRSCPRFFTDSCRNALIKESTYYWSRDAHWINCWICRATRVFLFRAYVLDISIDRTNMH